MPSQSENRSNPDRHRPVAESLATPMRLLQIVFVVLIALTCAFVAFAGTLVFSGEQQRDPAGLERIVVGLWALVLVAGFVVWPLFRNALASRAFAALTESGSNDKWVRAFQHYWVVVIAGVGIAQFTVLLAFGGSLATHHVALLLAMFPGLATTALLFPTSRKFERFLDRGRKTASANAA